MTSEQVEIARRRLRLGITNVGFWVVTATVGLWWVERCDISGFGFRRLGWVALAVVAAQAVFDVVGGMWLVPAPRPTSKAFLRRWLPGAIGHSLVLGCVGLITYASVRFTSGFVLAIVISTVGLAVSRLFLLRAIGGIGTRVRTHDGASVLVAENTSGAFTGGMHGFGRRARSVMPAQWLTALPREQLAAEASRRQWQIERGLPTLAFLLVLGWNLAGASLGSLAFALAVPPPAEGLLGYACWMTIWAFCGLLLLPSLSRNAVFSADRAAAESGHDPRSWIAHFATMIGEDGSAQSAVQAIFYPIPAAAHRLGQLEAPYSGLVLGSLARSNLYYSWATLTLLGRAVHCNVGQPALWVFPPSD